MTYALQTPEAIKTVLNEINRDRTLNAGIRAMSSRKADMPDKGLRMLMGAALDEASRRHLDRALDKMWLSKLSTASAEFRNLVDDRRDLIIGSGLHAAAYAVSSYFHQGVKPIVVEQSDRPGGIFAMTQGAGFWSNQRNRAGNLNIPGEGGSLMNIPFAQLQPSMVSADEFQANDAIALCVRVALAQCAVVVTNCEVKEVRESGSARRDTRAYVIFEGDTYAYCGNVLDARGLGDPRKSTGSWSTDSILTLPDFLRRMQAPFPLKDTRRVAVVGGGDSACCAIEALFGMGPRKHWSVPEMDRLDRVDWYGDLPNTCEAWTAARRTRYRRIGGLLPRDTRMERPSALRVLGESGGVTAGIGVAYVNERAYDLVIECLGWDREPISIPQRPDGGLVVFLDGRSVARRYAPGILSIGPAADLPFSVGEVGAGLNKLAENKVAAWRLLPRTAALGMKSIID